MSNINKTYKRIIWSLLIVVVFSEVMYLISDHVRSGVLYIGIIVVIGILTFIFNRQIDEEPLKNHTTLDDDINID